MLAGSVPPPNSAVAASCRAVNATRCVSGPVDIRATAVGFVLTIAIAVIVFIVLINLARNEHLAVTPGASSGPADNQRPDELLTMSVPLD